MKVLCIDVGNTSIHFGLVEERSVSGAGHFPTAPLHSGPSVDLTGILTSLVGDARGIAFCSVVPSIIPNLRTTLEQLKVPVFHLTHATCYGLELIYPKPSEIGEDRIANAVAAQAYHGAPAVVIDMGTAVTFDVLSTRGYEGGLIAPGLQVMTRYLHEQTALLPELTAEDLVEAEGAIGKSTIHAMKLGVAVGFSGMIDALLARVTADLKARGEPEPVILSTGGSISNLTKDWAAKSRFVPDLTLTGLGVAFNRSLS